jgi:hypothetical protein
MSATIRNAKTTGRVRLQRGVLAGLAGLAAGSLLLGLPAAAQAKVTATATAPADSTAQIQALLDNPVNGVVNLPSGTFTISPSLRLTRGEAIVGHNTTLKVAASSGDYWTVLTGATGITITGDKFLNTNNINTIATGGGARNVTISGNTFTGVSLPWHDHSSIYTSGTVATISNNTFTGSHDITAIEVHNDKATITGNTISGYYRGVNIVASDTTFTGNTITGSLGPVELWATAAPGLSNVTVTGNTLGQDLPGWALYLKTVHMPMPTGTETQQVFQAPTSTFPFSQITISGNTP